MESKNKKNNPISHGLEKLEKRIKRWPFNPKDYSRSNKEDLNRWQSGGSREERNQLPALKGHARDRALHKLHGQTSVRMSNTGEREFLLHRGASKDEVEKNKGNYFISHPEKTSWTSDINVANNFKKKYGGEVLSAWVPERFIHHVPSQVGDLGVGPNYRKDEREVIVKENHLSQLANINDLEKPYGKTPKENMDRLVNKYYRMDKSDKAPSAPKLSDLVTKGLNEYEASGKTGEAHKELKQALSNPAVTSNEVNDAMKTTLGHMKDPKFTSKFDALGYLSVIASKDLLGHPKADSNTHKIAIDSIEPQNNGSSHAYIKDIARYNSLNSPVANKDDIVRLANKVHLDGTSKIRPDAAKEIHLNDELHHEHPNKSSARISLLDHYSDEHSTSPASHEEYNKILKGSSARDILNHLGRSKNLPSHHIDSIISKVWGNKDGKEVPTANEMYIANRLASQPNISKEATDKLWGLYSSDSAFAVNVAEHTKNGEHIKEGLSNNSGYGLNRFIHHAEKNKNISSQDMHDIIDDRIKKGGSKSLEAIGRFRSLKPEHFDKLEKYLENINPSMENKIPLLNSLLSNENAPVDFLKNHYGHMTSALSSPWKASSRDRSDFKKSMRRVAQEDPDFYNNNTEFKLEDGKSVKGSKVFLHPEVDGLKAIKGILKTEGKDNISKGELSKRIGQVPQGIVGKDGKVTLESIDKYENSLPKEEYNISAEPWSPDRFFKSGFDPQMHDLSNVQRAIKVNATSKMIDSLKRQGLFDDYINLSNKIYSEDHPTDGHTLAWARVDTSKPGHWHIDELQSDLGDVLKRIMAKKKISEDLGISPEKAKKIHDILRGSHEDLEHLAHSAALENARNEGAQSVSLDTMEDQAKQSNLDSKEELPSKFKKIYRDRTKKLGYVDKNKQEVMGKAKPNHHIEEWYLDHIEAPENKELDSDDPDWIKSDPPWDEHSKLQFLKLFKSSRGNLRRSLNIFTIEISRLSKSDKVASVAVLSGKSILMGKRLDNDLWTLPGGHFEPGETPKQAAVRELFEESGISARPSQLKFLGMKKVNTPDGEKEIFAFAIQGKYKTTSKRDPDNEVGEWKYIDHKNGLPIDILDNLHSKKNITLNLLGLQKSDKSKMAGVPPATSALNQNTRSPLHIRGGAVTAKITDPKTKKTYWHHIGKNKEGMTHHVLSTSSNPSDTGIASVAVDKNYLRAQSGGHNQLLRDLINQYQNSEIHPAKIDSKINTVPTWEKHNMDIVHNIEPDLPKMSINGTSISPWAVLAGKSGEGAEIIAKAPLSKDVLGQMGEVDHKKTSYFFHPSFMTSHREAMYDKLANNVFGLGEYVPRTAVFEHPVTKEPWSAMKLIPGADYFQNNEAELDHHEKSGDIYKLALMNTVLGNRDRHLKNYMKDSNGDMKLIDHGLTFDYSNLTTDIDPHYSKHLINAKVPDHVIDWLLNIDHRKMINILQRHDVPRAIIGVAGRKIKELRRWAAMIKKSGRNGTLGQAFALSKIHSLRDLNHLNVADTRRDVYSRIFADPALAAASTVKVPDKEGGQ